MQLINDLGYGIVTSFLFHVETPPPVCYSQGGSPPDGAVLEQRTTASQVSTPTGN